MKTALKYTFYALIIVWALVYIFACENERKKPKSRQKSNTFEVNYKYDVIDERIIIIDSSYLE